jgi:electron transport complex protein RnfG
VSPVDERPVDPDRGDPPGQAGSAQAGADPSSHGPSLPVRTDVPAARLIGTLAVAGALAGLLIVSVFQWAQPRILRHQAEVLRQAITEVLGGPDRYTTLFVIDGRLTPDLATGADSADFEQVWVGYDSDGRSVGFAILGEEPGFQDVIRLIFGFDAQTGQVLGMKVLESKETPGLGDKIEKDTAFVAEFAGAGTPIEGVKRGAGSGAPEEVDMITGATISSRAVIAIINHRLEQLGPLIERYRTEGTQ